MRILAGFDVEVDAALREIGHKRWIRRDVALRGNRHMARVIAQLELERVL